MLEPMTDDLRADCSSCAGLCCVALAFSRSAGFGFDKQTGEPCINLQTDFGCRIHAELRPRGFPGCTVFDCGGAGQKVTQITFGGRTWREDPESSEMMFATFQVMRPLQELLWYLDDARRRPSARPVLAELDRDFRAIDHATRQGPDQVMATDIAAWREQIRPLLGRASELVRAEAQRGRSASRTNSQVRPGADLTGIDLGGQDLRGADLRGAQLIRTRLAGADLRGADVIGADFRDADLSGADLSDSLYLTQFQVSSADGDRQTKLSPRLSRPDHWLS